MKKCPKCNVDHAKPGIFCSRKCANSRNWTESDKLKKSIANKGNIPWNKGKCSDIFVYKNCQNLKCENKFLDKLKNKKMYCSKKCSPNMGGYREGSGRGKSGYYKGIFCASTYELAWVIYRLDHNLPVQRFEGFLQNESLKYYPDFIDENGEIIEIKGYYTKLVDDKCDLAKNKGYKIKVLYRKDLDKQFEWVQQNYKYKNLQELYDNYKPKYSYECCYCKKLCISDKIKETKNKFCSRRCSGKFTGMNNSLKTIPQS